MEKQRVNVEKFLFYFALTLIVYMPLHVFIVQSASLLTGGIEIWKAAKDVMLFLLAPLLLYVSYARGLWEYKWFRFFLIAGGLYALIHGVFVLTDGNDDTYSAIVGTVYNTRLLAYLLLGVLVGTSKNAKKYLKIILTSSVFIAFVVAIFGIMQYVLPPDILENVGYTLERGVKPLFFIDDKPDLPRVMSTLKDPNSLGAYLILPLLMTAYAFLDNKVNKKLFVKPIRKGVLAIMSLAMFAALLLTFSRGAALGLVLSVMTILFVVKGRGLVGFAKKYWIYGVGALVILLGIAFAARDTYFVQNVVFHADESTVLEDPNEKRLGLYEDSIILIVEEPLGYGPGTAGLVSINNPKGTVLNENYYLQVAHEVGWFGVALFVAILTYLFMNLYKLAVNKNELAALLLGAMVAYLFYSLLIHLWSNEAVALQWWLLTGLCLGSLATKDKIKL